MLIYKEVYPSFDTETLEKSLSNRTQQCSRWRKEQQATTDSASNTVRVQVLVLSDRCITIEEIMAELGLSHGAIWKILREQNHMSKCLPGGIPVSSRYSKRVYRAEVSKLMLYFCNTEEDFV